MELVLFLGGCRLTKRSAKDKPPACPKGAGQGKSPIKKRRRKKHTQQINMTKHIILRRSIALHEESTSPSLSSSDSSSDMASSGDESTSSRVSATGQTSADEAPQSSGVDHCNDGVVLR